MQQGTDTTVGQARVSRRADDDNIVDVVLDDLTFDELLRERADVMDAITRISTQLMDASRRPAPPEDDGPAWTAFRAWRRRARWALAFRKKELLDIKAVLHEKNMTSRAESLARMAELAPQRPVLTTEEQAARRARLQAELRELTPEALVARAYRLIRHVLSDGELPATLDQHDRDTLCHLTQMLRARHGRALTDGIARMDVAS